MRVEDPGHRYSVFSLDGKGRQVIQFVKRFRGSENRPGTINQELLRVLIDRVQFLDAEIRWTGNDDILQHLRMALVLHESRALFRKVEKGELMPEKLRLRPKDGHVRLTKGGGQ